MLYTLRQNCRKTMFFDRKDRVHSRLRAAYAAPAQPQGVKKPAKPAFLQNFSIFCLYEYFFDKLSGACYTRTPLKSFPNNIFQLPTAGKFPQTPASAPRSEALKLQSPDCSSRLRFLPFRAPSPYRWHANRYLWQVLSQAAW